MDKCFAPVIRLWPTVVAFADEVGCPERTAREWVRIDSIPASWFCAVAAAAQRRTAITPALADVSVETLAKIAEEKRKRVARQAHADAA